MAKCSFRLVKNNYLVSIAYVSRGIIYWSLKRTVLAEKLEIEPRGFVTKCNTGGRGFNEKFR